MNLIRVAFVNCIGVAKDRVHVLPSFIEATWDDVDILHLATHGNAYAGIPDASHLLLSNDANGQGTLIHYNDILRSDFSPVRLVVLMACLSKFGDQWAADEDLSLAWAFRAAGAEAVIGCRWEISDASCLAFTLRFYHHLLHDNSTVREAFALSIAEIRSKAEDHPQVWGAFALLD